jgi:hypothetical protein
MKCKRCGGLTKTANAQGFCSKCLVAIDKEAQVWQENDYLVRWLSTREDVFTLAVKRARVRAKRLRLVLSAIPEPMTFADRVARVRAHYTGEIKTRGKKKEVA